MRWEELQLSNTSRNNPDGKKGPGKMGGINGPGERYGHSCNAINGRNLLYVFGGVGKDDIRTNQVHVFDTDSGTWIKTTVKGNPPSPRDSHSCTTVGDYLFIFGGSDGENPLNDTHILDTTSNTWIEECFSGEGPEARKGHSAALFGIRIFIFGGRGKSRHSDKLYYNNLYILNTGTLEWEHAITSGILPSACYGHTCSSWKNTMIVVGGEDASYLRRDVHILDTDTLSWRELLVLSPCHILFSSRIFHSTVALGEKLFVFGGFNSDQKLCNDLHMLNVETGFWTEVMTTGQGPSGRFSTAVDCLDPSKGIFVFLGGGNENFKALDDMHYLHTGISVETGQDEQRQEKLSPTSLPANDKAVAKIGTMADLTQPIPLPSYGQAGKSSLESMSDAEHISNDSSAIISTPQVIMEVPKHVSSSGIRKLRIKLGKGKGKMDNNNGVSTSVSQPVSKGVDLGSSDTENMFLDIPIRKTELEIPKKVFLKSHPSNVKTMLSTGILEGVSVKYIPSKTEDHKKRLGGIIRGCGYLCGCDKCNLSKVVSARKFEKHAKCKSNYPNNHIFVGNGNSLVSVIKKIRRITDISSLDEVVKKMAQTSDGDKKGKQKLSLQGNVIEAKITKSLRNGFSIEATIDGKHLEGTLFFDQPSHSNSANDSLSRKRADVDIDDAKLNDVHEPQLKTARPLRQKEVDQRQTDGIRGKQSASKETVRASDVNNSVPVDVSQHHMVLENSEASIAPLLDPNDDDEIDAPNPNTRASCDNPSARGSVLSFPYRMAPGRHRRR